MVTCLMILAAVGDNIPRITLALYYRGRGYRPPAR